MEIITRTQLAGSTENCLHGKPFFFLLAIFITLLTFSGFIANSVNTPQRITHINFWTGLHAIFSTAWYCLLLLQLKLSRNGHLALHRNLGRFSALLVVAIIVTGAIMTFGLYERLVGFGIFDLNDSTARTRVGGLFGSTLFQWLSLALLYVFGLLTIRHPKHHKRFMIAASIQMMPEGLNRLIHLLGLPGYAMILIVALIYLSILIYDWKTERRFLWSSIVSITAFAVLVILIKTVFQSQLWGDWVSKFIVAI